MDDRAEQSGHGGRHDIRDALNTIVLNAELLVRILPEEMARPSAAAISVHRAACRLGELVEKELGSREARPGTYDVAETLREAVAGNDGRIRLILPETGSRGMGDPCALEHIVMKFTEEEKNTDRIVVVLERERGSALVRMRAETGGEVRRELALVVPLEGRF